MDTTEVEPKVERTGSKGDGEGVLESPEKQLLKNFYQSSVFDKLGLQNGPGSAAESRRYSEQGVIENLTIDMQKGKSPSGVGQSGRGGGSPGRESEPGLDRVNPVQSQPPEKPRQQISQGLTVELKSPFQPDKEAPARSEDPVLNRAIEQAKKMEQQSRNPQELAKLLDTPPGKDLPPVAEIFERNALGELGPEPKPNVYVSKDRTDKNIPVGSTVYSSINEAVQKSRPGSVIQVLPGIYRESVNFGASNSNIVLQTDRSNPAVIDGGNISIKSGAHDIAIRNLEVRNFSGRSAGIRVDGSNIKNITIAGTNVHSASGSEGIAVYGRAGEPVSNVRVIGNRIHNLSLDLLEAMPINGNVEDFKIKGNSGYELNNLFIDVIGGEGNGGKQDQPRQGEIAYNFGDGISSRENLSYRKQPSAAGIYSDGGRDLEIYGNYIRNSDFGIELASEHSSISSRNINVRDNIFEDSYLSWLTLGNVGGVSNSTLRNNLIIGNSKISRNGSASSVRIESNPIASNRRDAPLPKLIVEQLLK